MVKNFNFVLNLKKFILEFITFPLVLSIVFTTFALLNAFFLRVTYLAYEYMTTENLLGNIKKDDCNA